VWGLAGKTAFDALTWTGWATLWLAALSALTLYFSETGDLLGRVAWHGLGAEAPCWSRSRHTVAWCVRAALVFAAALHAWSVVRFQEMVHVVSGLGS